MGVIEEEFESSGHDLDLAVGVMRGARSFLVSDDEWLTGVVYKQRWLPGVNTATCMNNAIVHTTQHSMLACKHGFYAYHDGSNDYHHRFPCVNGTVSGVVEGFGEVMVGTRGFRCMKARIVALCMDDEEWPVKATRAVANYPGVPVFYTFEKMVAEFPPDKPGEYA